ncbi:class I SAM-dependent RNA methyltransferase [Gemmatimonas sp.]
MTIDRIAAGGDGVGRIDGLAVFVPRTAPGDVVQVAYVTHARHGRGRVLQVITPSPLRVTPPCVHYERDGCGGCQLQHLASEAQRDARQHIVQDSLARIGRRDVPLPTLEHGEAWAYRSRLSLTLRRRGSSWVGGLHPHDDPTRVFALESCRIAHPELVAVWESVRQTIRRGDLALPGTALPSGAVVPCDVLRLHLRLAPVSAGAETGSVSVVLQGGTAWPDEQAWTTAVQSADARIGGVWWTPDRVALRAADRRSAPPDRTATVVDYAPQGREALAFSQVNSEIAGALREFVYSAVAQFRAAHVIDGYAGAGELSARWLADGIAVTAIEADPAGAETAAARFRALGDAGRRGHVVCDLMEQAIASIDGAPDVVVLNPPRRGVHPDVAAWLEASDQRGVKGIVYISCDPATLARDLARLPSWRIAGIRCFDMFPQTSHVESVCVLRREDA